MRVEAPGDGGCCVRSDIDVVTHTDWLRPRRGGRTPHLGWLLPGSARGESDIGGVHPGLRVHRRGTIMNRSRGRLIVMLLAPVVLGLGVTACTQSTRQPPQTSGLWTWRHNLCWFRAGF